MLSPEEVAAAGKALFEAERSGRQIGLLTRKHPMMSMEDAYAIQADLCARKRTAGAAVIGWKIGLTSKAMQDALKIDVPDSGILFDDMVFENGAAVPAGRFIKPRIEAEIAFMIRDSLCGPGVTPEDVLKATDHVTAALEILDTRIVRRDPETGELRKIFDTIADNAANAGIVLGDTVHEVGMTDLRRVGVIVKRNGAVEETGLGAGVLDDPALAVAWLASRLGRYGQCIEAGQVVLSGSFVRPVEAPSGSRIVADFGVLGQVACGFD